MSNNAGSLWNIGGQIHCRRAQKSNIHQRLDWQSRAAGDQLTQPNRPLANPRVIVAFIAKPKAGNWLARIIAA
jgi:hypothetical protein